jgi:hypothetical protein
MRDRDEKALRLAQELHDEIYHLALATDRADLVQYIDTAKEALRDYIRVLREVAS